MPDATPYRDVDGVNIRFEVTIPLTADSARAAAKRRSGSLSTMLLPDLQQLAGSLGIAPGKLKKSDLVAAIQSAQTATGGSAAGTAGSASGSTGTTATARVRSRAPRSRSHGRKRRAVVRGAFSRRSTRSPGSP